MLRPTWHRIITVHARSHWRPYSTKPTSAKSAHAQWYSDLLPGMVPVALLGSAVYLGLQLAQGNLAHEKYLDETRARVRELEAEVAGLRSGRQNTPVTPSAKTVGWFRWG